MSSSANKAFYDEALSQIAQRAGSIDSLLDEFFDFLHRRTDFYVQYPLPSSQVEGRQYSMGFPEGKAEEILLKSFRKNKYRDYSETASPSPSNFSSESNKTQFPEATSDQTSVAVKKLPTLQLTAEGKQVPIGNGGVGESYYWTQSLTEITVYVEAPHGVKGKDISCNVQSLLLYLAVAGNLILEGEFEEPVRAKESMWTISQGLPGEAPQVVLNLEKSREGWWKHVLHGHPEIDTSKVDSTKSISEYDVETQGAIRKLVFEQRQKVSIVSASLSIY
jgi:hypothetical protein